MYPFIGYLRSMIDLLRSATPELGGGRWCCSSGIAQWPLCSLAMFAMWTILLCDDVPRLSKKWVN
jgi:hypothetical protein